MAIKKKTKLSTLLNTLPKAINKSLVKLPAPSKKETVGIKNKQVFKNNIINTKKPSIDIGKKLLNPTVNKNLIAGSLASKKLLNPTVNKNLIAGSLASKKLNEFIKSEVLKIPVSLIIKKLPVIKPIQGRKNAGKIDVSGDKLSYSELTVNNLEYKLAGSVDNISVLRPEIISLFNFHSIYDGNAVNKKLNPYGKFIELNFQTSYIHKNTSVELFKNMEKAFEDADPKDIGKKALTNIKQNTKNHLNNLSDIINYQFNVVNDLNQLETKLDLKKIPDFKFKKDKHYSLKEYFVLKNGYTPEQFDSYTNTKIYFQLITDFRNILENYSFDLLNLKDEDRKDDFDPVKIDKTYTIQDNFTFKVSQLGNSNKLINALDKKVFNDFLSSLPKESSKKIKILTTVCAKELLISKQLSDSALTKDFDIPNNGNPFDNILGIPGQTIFDKPLGNNSISSLAYLNTNIIDNKNKNNSFFVLPFEKKYLDIVNKPSHFIPGSSYFIDSIFQTKENELNIEPFNEFLDNFNDTISKNLSALYNLFLLDIPSSEKISAEYYYKFLMFFYIMTFNELSTSNTNVPSNGDVLYDDPSMNLTGRGKNSIVMSSLYKLANKDNKLKHLLFQFVLLAGLHISKQEDVTGEEVWDLLSEEISDLRNFPFFKQIIDINFTLKNPDIDKSLDLKNKDKLSAYTWALELLAEAIENRCAEILLNKKSLDSNDKKSKNSLYPSESYVKELKKSLTQELDGIDLYKGSIKTSLLYSMDKNNSIQTFFYFINGLLSFATKKNSKSIFVDDGSGRTRFNYLSCSSLILMNFEIYSSFIERYSYTSFIPYDKGSVVVAIWNSKVNKNIIQGIQDVYSGKHLNEIFDRITNEAGVSLIRNLVKNNFNKNLLNISKKKNTSVLGTKQIVKPKDIFSLTTKQLTNNIIKIDKTNITNNSSKMLNYLKNNSNFTNSISDTEKQLIEELFNTKDKFINEEENIKHILNIFSVLNENILEAKMFLNTNYSKDNVQRNLLRLSYIKEKDSTTGKELPGNSVQDYRFPMTFSKLKSISDIQQVYLGWYHYYKFLERFTQPELDSLNSRFDVNSINTVSMDIPHKDVKNTLLSYLRSEEFTESGEANTRMKILSFGIPNGFRSSLVDRFSYNDLSKNKKDILLDKQMDLIKVSVYKRNLRLNDIVFKPQTFIFDLSLFLLPSGIQAAKPNLNDEFDKILKKITFFTFETTNGNTVPFNNQYISLENNELLNSNSIKTIQTYNILNNDDKKTLLKNHAISLLLETYINLMSGIKINEETFTEDTDNSLGITNERINSTPNVYDKDMEKAIIVFLKEKLGVDIQTNISLQGLLESDNVDSDIKNTIRTITLGNEFISPLVFRSKVLNKNTFERVFNIPINIDSFEINFEETNKTASGKNSFNSLISQNMIIEKSNKYYLKNRDEEDIILDDLFITIDNLI